MLTDDQLAITCIADEAGNQPHEGRVAVGCVLLNRMRALYESDGTVPGTVLKHFQFSGFWFAMKAGHYTQIEWDRAGAAAQAGVLYSEFSTSAIWADCELAWQDAHAWIAGAPMSFTPGPQFQRLGPHTLLYFDPRICVAPAWATPQALCAVIYNHTFYND